MASVGIGVIGCGYWGPQLVRNFSGVPTAEMLAVADMQPDRRLMIEGLFPHIQTTADHRQLLHDPRIDAVVVATPIRTHFRLAKEALLHGKHVLVEKPLAASTAEAEELVELADRLDRRLMVGHTFEYNPAVSMLRDLVQCGRLGRIRYIDAARLNLGLFQKDVNVIWDLAPHDISILLYVLNQQPLTVAARGYSWIRRAVEDVAYIELVFPCSIVAHVHVSWLEPSKVRRVTVVGDQRMVVYNDVSAEEKIRIFDKGVDAKSAAEPIDEYQLSYRYGDITSPRISWQEPLRTECSHFVDAILSGSRPQSDGVSGTNVVRILERANQSLALGGVRLDLKTGAIASSETPELALGLVS